MLSLFCKVEQRVSLAGTTASVNNLMVVRRKHCEKRPNIYKRLHESLSINGFGPPLNAEEGCINLIIRAFIFGHGCHY